ncbi:MAG: isochorismate synthase [Microcystaceae cyanobacterium]|jgi:hypothetical protein
MNIQQSVQDLVQYFTEAFARIFGPSTDEYPEVGVQPFGGESYRAGTEDR